MMPLAKPHREPWNGFRDVVIVADVNAVKKHAEYQQAMQSKRFSSCPCRGPFWFQSMRWRAKATTVSLAHSPSCLRRNLNLQVETAIVQANVVNHTGASGWERMARPPVFAGSVVVGRSYVLVDDFVGQGGTLANLRGHIIHGGGLVQGAVTLTGQPYSAKLALQPETLEALRAKHGQEIENWWNQRFGYGFAGLTESEARYLLRAEDADTIRARLSEAGPQGDD